MASAWDKDDDDDDAFPIISSFKAHAGVKRSESLKSIVCDDRNVIIHFADQLSEVNRVTECLLDELNKCEEEDKILMHLGRTKRHKHGVLRRTSKGELVFYSDDIEDQPKEDCLVCQLLSLQERIDNVVVDRLIQIDDFKYLKSMLNDLKDLNCEQDKLDEYIQRLLGKLDALSPKDRRTDFGKPTGERKFDELEDEAIPDIRKVGHLISDLDSGFGKIPKGRKFRDIEQEKYLCAGRRPRRRYDEFDEAERETGKPSRFVEFEDLEDETEYVVTKPCNCGIYCTCSGKKGKDCECYDDLFNLVRSMNIPPLTRVAGDQEERDKEFIDLEGIDWEKLGEEEPAKCCDRDYPHIHTVFNGQPMVLRLTSKPPPEEEEAEPEPEIIYIEPEPDLRPVREPEPYPTPAEPEPKVIEEELVEEEEEEEEKKERKSCGDALNDFWNNTVRPAFGPLCSPCVKIRMKFCDPDCRRKPRDDMMFYT